MAGTANHPDGATLRQGPVSPARARLVLCATALVSMTVGIEIGALGPALPALHARLQAPLDQLGILFGASFAGALVSTLGLGPMLDRRPPRLLLAVGVAALALGLLLVTLATSLIGAVAALALAGIGGGTNSIGSAVLATRLFGRQGGRALSLVNMSFGLGACAGPPIAATVLNAVHDYRPLFVGMSAWSLVPLLIYAVSPLPSAAAGVRAPSWTLPRGAVAPVLALSALTFLYLGTEVGFAGWAFTYLRQTTNAGVATASWASAGFWLALSISSLGAAVRPRSWRAEYVVLLCTIGALGMALAFLAARGSTALEIAGAASVGLFLGPIYPLSLATAANLVPASAGRIAAIVIACAELGGTVLPWVQGMLLAFGAGWSMALTLTGCAGMAALQLIVLRRHDPYSQVTVRSTREHEATVAYRRADRMPRNGASQG